MGRVCSRMEEDRSAFKMLTGKSTGKRPLGRLSCRWEDNIRISRVIFNTVFNIILYVDHGMYYKFYLKN